MTLKIKYCQAFKSKISRLKREKAYFYSQYEKFEISEVTLEEMEKYRKNLNEKINSYKENTKDFMFEQSCLYFLMKLINKRALSKHEIAISLAGITGENAEALRKEKNVEYNSLSYTGLDTEKAWEERKRALSLMLMENLSLSLNGLDNKRAWEMREKIKNNTSEGEVLKSIIGLNSEKAWEYRNEFLEDENFNKYNKIAYSLAGLNNKRSWEMRKKLMEKGARMDHIMLSLSGISSARSWELREDMRKLIRNVNANIRIKDALVNLGMSLMGLDSEKSWEYREYFKSINAMDAYALSLGGVKGEKAKNARKDLLKQHINNSNFDIGTLSRGTYGTFIMVGVRKARTDSKKETK